MSELDNAKQALKGIRAALDFAGKKQLVKEIDIILAELYESANKIEALEIENKKLKENRLRLKQIPNLTFGKKGFLK